MNKRIQEIAKRVADNLDPEDCMVSEEFLEKYTELIVKECAHLVGGYTKENEFGTDTDVKEAYEEITKHFGVKE